MGQGKRASMRDVAAEAGVSLGTVARTFSEESVSDELAGKVRAAAERLGFVPQQNRDQQIWGVIVPDLTSPFFPAVIRALQYEASQRGARLVVCDSRENIEDETAALELMASIGVHALVVAPVSEEVTDLREFKQRRRRAPIVAFDRRPARGTADVVLVDNHGGAYDATKLLISRGYQRIACILSPLDVTSSRERQSGYTTALLEANRAIEPELLHVVQEANEEGGRNAVGALLALLDPPDAIFVTNELMLEGALEVVQNKKSSVVLVGFDDPYWASNVASVAQPIKEIGKEIARRIDQPKEGETRLKPELLRVKLVPKK